MLIFRRIIMAWLAIGLLDDVEQNDHRIVPGLFPASETRHVDDYLPPAWYQPEQPFVPETGDWFIESQIAATNRQQAREHLGGQAIEKIYQLMRTSWGISDPQTVGLEPSYVLDNLVYDNRLEIKKDLEFKIRSQTLGVERDGFHGYAQLKMDRAFQEYLKQRYIERKTQQRLKNSGIVGAALFSMLLLGFGYFKLELATRRFYSRRLQTVFILLALLLVGLFCWLSMNI